MVNETTTPETQPRNVSRRGVLSGLGVVAATAALPVLPDVAHAAPVEEAESALSTKPVPESAFWWNRESQWPTGGFWSGRDIGNTGDAWMDGSGRPLLSNHLKIHQLLVDSLPARYPANRAHTENLKLETATFGLRINKRAKVQPGYTLIAAAGGFRPTGKKGNVILVDNGGAVVQEWTHANGISGAKLLPNGDLVCTTWVDGNAKLSQMDWNGRVVKVFDSVPSHVHHDMQREGLDVGYWSPYARPKLREGRSLMITTDLPSLAASRAAGMGDNPVELDTFYEVDWRGRILWSWRTFDHLADFGLGESAWNAIRLGLNDGIRGGANAEDITHANAITWIGDNAHWSRRRDWRFHPNNVMVDYRSLNLIQIIARQDGGGFRNGQIVWQMGPDYGPSSPDGKVGQIIGQHQAHIIPRGLPGEGNLLVFDNHSGAGYGSLLDGLISEGGRLEVPRFTVDRQPNPVVVDTPKGYRLGHYPNRFGNYSRVLEIDPITRDIVWQYLAPVSQDRDGDGKYLGNEPRFFTSIMGSAQRLANGNTLIGEANTSRVFEVTPDWEVVWEFVIEVKGEPPLGPQIYRAARVPLGWVPVR